MNYTGTNFGVVEQGIVDIDLVYQRTLDSSSNVAINESSITNATFVNLDSLTPVVEDDNYKVIEFDLDIDYLGTEISDVLTVGGTVSGTLDSDKWSLTSSMVQIGLMRWIWLSELANHLWMTQ